MIYDVFLRDKRTNQEKNKNYEIFFIHCHTTVAASVAQLDVPSDWRPGSHGFNPCRGRQHSFVEIDHEIFSVVNLSLR